MQGKEGGRKKAGTKRVREAGERRKEGGRRGGELLSSEAWQCAGSVRAGLAAY